MDAGTVGVDVWTADVDAAPVVGMDVATDDVDIVELDRRGCDFDRH